MYASVCVGGGGVVFHIHALLGVRTKRDSKTMAAGARPSRHERGEDDGAETGSLSKAGQQE